MQRLENWRSELFNYVAEHKDQEFKYGKFDCCLFGAGAISAQTGVDIAEKYRGKYRSLKGGFKLLRKDGYKSYSDFISKHLNEIESAAFAQVGDIGIVVTDDGEAICIIMGAFAIGVSENGLVQFQLNHINRVFRIN